MQMDVLEGWLNVREGTERGKVFFRRRRFAVSKRLGTGVECEGGGLGGLFRGVEGGGSTFCRERSGFWVRGGGGVDDDVAVGWGRRFGPETRCMHRGGL